MNTLAVGLRLLWALSLLALFACTSDTTSPSAPSAVQFNDVTDAAGLDFSHFNGFSGDYYYVETVGSGAAFFDYDGDGWLDLYLANGAQLTGIPMSDPPRNQLYHNESGHRFVDVSGGSGSDDDGYGMGVAAADYDNDGDQDLYVTNFGANLLLRNDGGRGKAFFADVTEEMSVGDQRWGASAGFFDYDNDGDLDLMVVNYLDFTLAENIICQKGQHRSYCDPTEFEPIADLLYRNDGTQFTDVTDEAGITLLGRGLGIAFADYDVDGDTDVYVANDKNMNFLYENRQGTFEEVGLLAGGRYNAEGLAEAGMGVDFGDVDNDGNPEIYVTNFGGETNTLYVNDGHGEFRDGTDRFDLSQPSLIPLGFGTRFLDYDGDGFLDLFVANGHVLDNIADILPDRSYAQPNQMMRNLGGLRFKDVSASLGPGLQVEAVSRGTAVADYDNDGDVDMLVTNISAAPTLLRNDGEEHGHWLLIELVGSGHRDAIGSKVIVTAAGMRQVRERQSGGSYLSSHDPRLHFGLGEATSADINIVWPDGEVQSMTAVAADQIVRIVQAENGEG